MSKEISTGRLTREVPSAELCGINGQKWRREPSRWGRDALNHGGVDFDSHRSLQHFDGHEELPNIPFPEQNPFKSLQRAASEPDSVTAFQEGVRFRLERTSNHSSDGLNLRAGNHRALAAESQDTVNPGVVRIGCQRSEWAVEEYVARGRGEGTAACPDLSSGEPLCTEEERLRSFTGQNAGYIFFVLVTRMHRVPC